LTQRLIRVPSLTPDTGAALDVVEETLARIGFVSERMPFHTEGQKTPTANLVATLGERGPHVCFLGHTDVVPIFDADAWRFDPFAATIDNDIVYGRGANDMKGAIAAFCVAAARVVEQGLPMRLSVVLTGDEEGPGHDGSKRIVKTLQDRGVSYDVCLVGEPSCQHTFGDMAKVGRRGSLHGVVTARGQTGHVAYPHRADNPVTHLVAALHALKATPIDAGNSDFPPSNLEVLDLFVGNDIDNVIPKEARGRFNIRFNSEWTPASLKAELDRRVAAVSPVVDIAYRLSGDSFLAPQGALRGALLDAVQSVTGQAPQMSTTGGTSDGRFMKEIAPVIEYGLVGQTMHKANECAAVADLRALCDVYTHFLRNCAERIAAAPFATDTPGA